MVDITLVQYVVFVVLPVLTNIVEWFTCFDIPMTWPAFDLLFFNLHNDEVLPRWFIFLFLLFRFYVPVHARNIVFWIILLHFFSLGSAPSWSHSHPYHPFHRLLRRPISDSYPLSLGTLCLLCLTFIGLGILSLSSFDFGPGANKAPQRNRFSTELSIFSIKTVFSQYLSSITHLLRPVRDGSPNSLDHSVQLEDIRSHQCRLPQPSSASVHRNSSCILLVLSQAVR